MRRIIELPDFVPYETMRQKTAQWAIVFCMFCGAATALFLAIAALIVVVRWHQ